MEDKRKYNGRKKGNSNLIQGELKEKNPAPNSAKANFRDESTLSSKEFLKVRPGESQEEWEKRTAKKRVYKTADGMTIKVAHNGKLAVSKRRAKGKSKELIMQIRVRFHERPYDYLKMYAFVLRWANVRFGILKDDLEIGYYFFEGTPFTKQEFELICNQLGSVRGVFPRFLKKRYLANISIMTQEGVMKNTEYYQLSTKFNNVLRNIYDLLSKVNPVTTTDNQNYKKVNPELKATIDRMNDEIIETLSGAKKQELIKEETEN